MAKYVPGPWSIEEDNGNVFGIKSGKPMFVGTVRAPWTDQGKANTRLIIQAPDMLGMLMAIENAALNTETDDSMYVDITLHREDWNELLRLIARAKGEPEPTDRIHEPRPEEE